VTYKKDNHYAKAVKVERTGHNGWTARVNNSPGIQFIFMSGGDPCAKSVSLLTDAKSLYDQTVSGCKKVLHTTPDGASDVCNPDPKVEVPTLEVPKKSDDGKSWSLKGDFCPREGQTTWAVSVTETGNGTVYNYYKYVQDDPVGTDPKGSLTEWTAVVPDVSGPGGGLSIRLLWGASCDAVLHGGGQRQSGGYYSVAKTAVDTACTTEVTPEPPYVPFPSNNG